MTELTLGISPCPNDVYIFSGLLLGQVPTGGVAFNVDYQDVETLNDRAQAGALDVCKISYANYIHCQKNYNLLPNGGALGRGVGPLLLANGGAWNPDAEVLVPGEYTTANFLLDFYAGRPLKKRFLPFDALYARLLGRAGSAGRGHSRETLHLCRRRPDADPGFRRLLGARDELCDPARSYCRPQRLGPRPFGRGCRCKPALGLRARQRSVLPCAKSIPKI